MLFVQNLSKIRMFWVVLLWGLGLVVGIGMPKSALAKIRVVASVPSLGALAKAVGGKYVEVQSLAPATQDPHFVDGRPSYIVHLNRADLLIYVGADLEIGWLPPLITNSRNGRIQPGQTGNLDASTVCGQLLLIPQGDVDRRMGDVHTNGNPHFLYNPHYGLRVAKAIAERLAILDAPHQNQYRNQFAAFQKAMQTLIAAWETRMKPYRGRTVVGYHQSLIYLTTWLQLRRGGFIEPVPGIRPNPRHLATLILYMRRNRIQVVLSEPWFNAEVSRVVVQRTQSAFVALPGDVGVPGISSYQDFIGRIVSSLEQAFKKTPQGK